MEPEPVPIDFRPIQSVDPDFVMVRGEYRGSDGYTYVLTGAAPRAAANKLQEYSSALRFWALTTRLSYPPEEDEPTDSPGPQDLVDYIRAVGEYDEPAGAVVGLLLELPPVEDVDTPAETRWHIDPTQPFDDVNCYVANQRRVDVSCRRGDRIRFRWGQGNNEVTEVPPNLSDQVVGRGTRCHVRVLSRPNATYWISGLTYLWG